MKVARRVWTSGNPLGYTWNSNKTVNINSEEELINALKNASYKGLVLDLGGKNIANTSGTSYLCTVPLAGIKNGSINNNLTMSTNEEMLLFLEKDFIINGDLIIDAPNGEIINSSKVNGVTIKNVKSGTFINNGSITGNITIEDADGGAFENHGSISGDIKVNPTIAPTAPVILKGSINVPVKVEGEKPQVSICGADVTGTIELASPNTSISVFEGAKVSKVDVKAEAINSLISTDSNVILSNISVEAEGLRLETENGQVPTGTTVEGTKSDAIKMNSQEVSAYINAENEEIIFQLLKENKLGLDLIEYKKLSEPAYYMVINKILDSKDNLVNKETLQDIVNNSTIIVLEIQNLFIGGPMTEDILMTKLQESNLDLEQIDPANKSYYWSQYCGYNYYSLLSNKVESTIANIQEKIINKGNIKAAIQAVKNAKNTDELLLALQSKLLNLSDVKPENKEAYWTEQQKNTPFILNVEDIQAYIVNVGNGMEPPAYSEEVELSRLINAENEWEFSAIFNANRLGLNFEELDKLPGLMRGFAGRDLFWSRQFFTSKASAQKILDDYVKETMAGDDLMMKMACVEFAKDEDELLQALQNLQTVLFPIDGLKNIDVSKKTEYFQQLKKIVFPNYTSVGLCKDFITNLQINLINVANGVALTSEEIVSEISKFQNAKDSGEIEMLIHKNVLGLTNLEAFYEDYGRISWEITNELFSIKNTLTSKEAIQDALNAAINKVKSK